MAEPRVYGVSGAEPRLGLNGMVRSYLIKLLDLYIVTTRKIWL